MEIPSLIRPNQKSRFRAQNEGLKSIDRYGYVFPLKIQKTNFGAERPSRATSRWLTVLLAPRRFFDDRIEMSS